MDDDRLPIDKQLARDILDGLLVGEDGFFGNPDYEPNEYFWENDQRPGIEKAIRDWAARHGLALVKHAQE